jgi:signal transduction histidine kinase
MKIREDGPTDCGSPHTGAAGTEQVPLGVWQQAFQAMSKAACLLDSQGEVARWNRGLTRLFRPALNQQQPRAAREVIGEWLRTSCGLDWRQRGAREVPFQGRWLRVSARPVTDEQGAVTGSLLLFADITARKDREERLRQAQQQQHVVRLAAGLQHDLINLLTVVTGYTSLLLATAPPGSRDQGLLTAVEKASWQAVEVSRQLLASSPVAQRLKAVCPTQLVRDVLALLGQTLDPAIRVEVRTARDVWTIRADACQLQRALMNLCLNARDAMPQGGTLTVEVENCTVDGLRPTSLHPEARPGEFVRLGVRDTGQGIPPEQQRRIFEPFFTTKGPGKGTGLGLAVVLDVVRQAAGWVTCASEEGRGTTFEMYLPRYRPVHEPPAGASP